MTEEEAAQKLAALLNEIEAAGHRVNIRSPRNDAWLEVGLQHTVKEPQLDDSVWEVETP